MSLPVGTYPPTQQQICIWERETLACSLLPVVTLWITWRTQENTRLQNTAPCMLTGLKHVWLHSKKSSWSSVFWAELSMSALSKKELLILCPESNFSSTFIYKHYRISVFFQQFYGNKQLTPPFHCQLLFSDLRRGSACSLVQKAWDLLEMI